VDPLLIQRLLRHSSFKVSEEVYIVCRRMIRTHAALYAEDVWWIGEEGFEVKSRNDFETMYAQIYQSGMVVKELKYITEELTVSNDIAVQMGWYSMTLESQGQEDKSKYKYMVAWQRQPYDSWKVYRGMSISIKVPE
jgi:ketosteroid isomerase-like protein